MNRRRDGDGYRCCLRRIGSFGGRRRFLRRGGSGRVRRLLRCRWLRGGLVRGHRLRRGLDRGGGASGGIGRCRRRGDRIHVVGRLRRRVRRVGDRRGGGSRLGGWLGRNRGPDGLTIRCQRGGCGGGRSVGRLLCRWRGGGDMRSLRRSCPACSIDSGSLRRCLCCSGSRWLWCGGRRLRRGIGRGSRRRRRIHFRRGTGNGS